MSNEYLKILGSFGKQINKHTNRSKPVSNYANEFVVDVAFGFYNIAMNKVTTNHCLATKGSTVRTNHCLNFFDGW
jgi:hypothetical protein